MHLPQETQTELVMLILLRLAEDVIFFQTLPAQRRRDIQQKLTQNMDSIFTFMMTILRVNVEELRKLVSEHSFCFPKICSLNSRETKISHVAGLLIYFLNFSRKCYLVMNSRWEMIPAHLVWIQPFTVSWLLISRSLAHRSELSLEWLCLHWTHLQGI